MGIAECNTYWPKINEKERLYDKTRGWFESIHVNTAYNNTEPKISRRFQPGGVVSLTTDRMCHKILDKGHDSMKLGRWSWVRYEGKKGRILRIITAYRPTKNIRGGGSNKAYIQHLRYLEKENRGRRPREAFMEDLKMK